MNKRDMIAYLMDKPDNFQIKFSSEGFSYDVGYAMMVPEWQIIYLGTDKEELHESLNEEMEADAEDDDEVLEERDVFLQALENAENTDDLEGDPTCDVDTSCCAVEGSVPHVPKCGVVVLRNPPENDSVGVM
jgi:hypothetical protein